MIPGPHWAKHCAQAVPVLCPAQVLQQIVHAVSQEEDSTLLLLWSNVGIRIFPAFYPELTPLPWH